MAFGSVFTRFGAAVVGLLSGGAAARAVRPVFELVEQQSWDGNPNRLIGPNQLAELVATAITDFDGVAPEAQRQGYAGQPHPHSKMKGGKEGMPGQGVSGVTLLPLLLLLPHPEGPSPLFPLLLPLPRAPRR